jgi:hypothetical protein
MQYLVLTRRRSEAFSEAEFAERLPAEGEQARILYAEGFIRQVWHRADVPGVCLFVEAVDEREVRSRLQTLPLVAAMMLELSVVVRLLPYRGFAPAAAVTA